MPHKRGMQVGTEAGSKTSALQGMLLHPGTYEAAFQIVALRESMRGPQLPVDDYAISHPLRIHVVDEAEEASGTGELSDDVDAAVLEALARD